MNEGPSRSRSPSPLNTPLLPPTGPTTSHRSPPAPCPFLRFQARWGPRQRQTRHLASSGAVSTPSLHSIPPTYHVPSPVQRTRAQRKNAKFTRLRAPGGQDQGQSRERRRALTSHPLLRGCWRMSLSCARHLSSQAGKPWAAPSLAQFESVPLSTETGLAHLPPSSQGLSRGPARSREVPKFPKGRALLSWPILSPSHLRVRTPPSPLGSSRQSSGWGPGAPQYLGKAPLLPKTQLPICAQRGFSWTTSKIPSGFHAP